MEGLVCLVTLVLGVLPLGLLAWIASVSSATHRLQQRVDSMEEQLRVLNAELARAPGSAEARTLWKREGAAPAPQQSGLDTLPDDLQVDKRLDKRPDPALPASPGEAQPDHPAQAKVAPARPDALPEATFNAVSTLVPMSDGLPPIGAPSQAEPKPAEPKPADPAGAGARSGAEPGWTGGGAGGGAGGNVPPGAPTRPAPSGSSSPGLSAERLGLWVLSAAGASLLLMAALFAFREAIAAGWIGPGVRFLLGIAVGMGAWVASGLLYTRKYVVPAGALGGAGSAVLYGALYAGIARYGLLSQPVAFGSMILVTVCTMIGAVKQGSRLQATLGAIGGYMTPLLLSTGENKALAFFFYLCLLNSGLIVAARRRGWPDQVALAGAVTPVLYCGWVASFHAPDQMPIGLGGALLLAAPFLAAGLIGRTEEKTEATHTVSWVAGALMVLMGAGYVFPADPMSTDPISGAPLRWALGPAAAMAAGYVLLAGLILNAPIRRMKGAEGWLLAAIGTAIPLMLMLVQVAGWADTEPPAWGPIAVTLIGLPVLLAGAGQPGGWGGPAGWGVSAVLAAVLTLGLKPEGQWVLLQALGLGLPPAVLLRISGPRVMMPLMAFVGPMILLAAWPIIPEMTGSVLIASLALYVTWFVVPFVEASMKQAQGAGDGKDGAPAFDEGTRAGVMSAALIGLFLFEPLRRVWVTELGDGGIGLLPLLLGGALLMGGTLLVQRKLLKLDSPDMSVILGLVMLGASVSLPLQLDHTWLTLGWAVEVALLSLLHPRIRQPLIQNGAFILALIVAWRLFFSADAWVGEGGQGADGMIVLNWSLYTWGVPMVALFVAAQRFRQAPAVAMIPGVFYTLGIGMGFALLNIEISHAFARDGRLSFLSGDLAQEMTRSIGWACFGLLLILVGVWRESRWTRLAGLLFALLGVAKACLFDMWQLSGFYRVGSFFCMAIALMLAAIAFQRMVLRDEKTEREEREKGAGGKDNNGGRGEGK